MATTPPKPSSRRRSWLLFFWGGTGLACAGLVLFLVVMARAQLDRDEPLALLSAVTFVSGFTLRRMAKQAVDSIEKGEVVKFDRFGPTISGMLERSAPFAQPLQLGTAEPEPGLRRHVVVGDWVLIGVAAALIVAALVLVS